MELLSGYAALLVGMGVGYIAARARWRLMPIVAVGGVAVAALAFYQSTVTFHPSEPWSGTIATPLWVAIAGVTAGAWVLGLGIGTTLRSRLNSGLDGSLRRPNI